MGAWSMGLACAGLDGGDTGIALGMAAFIAGRGAGGVAEKPTFAGLFPEDKEEGVGTGDMGEDGLLIFPKAMGAADGVAGLAVFMLITPAGALGPPLDAGTDITTGLLVGLLSF